MTMLAPIPMSVWMAVVAILASASCAKNFPQVSFVKLKTFFGPVQPGVAAGDLAIDQVRLNVQYP